MRAVRLRWLFAALVAMAACGCGPKLTESERTAGKPASANFETHRVEPPPGYDPTRKPAALQERLARKAKQAEQAKKAAAPAK